MSDSDKTRISPNPGHTGVGTQLSGIYELDERIASGGMGEVYRGHNIQTGDHVAIKIVLPEFARDQTILSLFRKEASILNHLSHDAVVRYHVFTIDPGIGRPYLAMEFVDGQSLFDVIRRGAMSPPDVRRLCHRLASGLSAVHQAGAVHRDLSPDNIILPGGRVERAKIIDFGIARSATVGGETLIGGRFAGKYNYVSPEQLGLYGGEVSEQSDIYSLGLVLAAALRGKPLDMSGSQYEVIEKRRAVPDLSDIDVDFRELITAMLQPDPRDRPASMAEIARATRDDDFDATLPPPASFTPRERSGLPSATWTAPPGARTQPSTPPGEQRFVAHVRPAYLSEPRPSPAAAPARAAAPAPQRKSSRIPAIAGGAVGMAMVAAAGIYFSGILTPLPVAEKVAPLKPAPAPKPVTEPSKSPAEASAPQPPAPTEPDTAPSNNAASSEPANPVAPTTAQPQANTAPIDKPADSVAGQSRTSPSTEAPSPSIRPSSPLPAPPGAEVQQPAQTVPVQSQNVANSTPETTPTPPATVTPAPSPTKVTPAAPPAEMPAQTTPSQTLASNKLEPAQQPTRIAPAPSPNGTAATPIAPSKTSGSQRPTPPAATPTTPKPPTPTVTQPETTKAPAQLPQQPETKPPANTEVAMNLPKPQAPPPPADQLTQRASWVRDFSGGSCFYASLTSATDTSAAIEGFATAVQPFEQLLADFQSRFHVEPDISVRLINPPQCGVPTFLRLLDRNGVERPQLLLDRTSVPDGSPISGTVVTRGGLISNVLLINHNGIAFNLDDRMVAQPDKATFSIPIDLAAADKAAGKALPQVIMVITGPQDIQAAMFSKPTPASEVLPRIMKEIEARGPGFSATAKYFRLGG